MVSNQIAPSVGQGSHVSVGGATTEVMDFLEVVCDRLVEYIESWFDEPKRLMEAYATNALRELLPILVVAAPHEPRKLTVKNILKPALKMCIKVKDDRTHEMLGRGKSPSPLANATVNLLGRVSTD